MKKKSLSVKKIIPRKLNFNKFLRDKKIIKIYNNFKKNFENLINSKKIAVSVSGGADSLALCFLVLCYKFKKNIKIQPSFYLVDHGLRENSSIEVRKVSGWLEAHGIDNHILSWGVAKPKSGIQAAARIARYDLMTSWCKEHKISPLLTAHHLEDQVETFLLRLECGSRLDGLSSMEYIRANYSFESE